MSKELETKFIKIIEEANERIKKHLADASAALYEAIKVSEETGVSFYSNTSFLGNTYVPSTFQKIFVNEQNAKLLRAEQIKVEADHDNETHDELQELEKLLDSLGLYMNEYGEYGVGWEHSAVC